MNVLLYKHTPDPDRTCAEAAAMCTGYAGDPVKALKGAMASGHESVAEHANFTFVIEGVSRVLLAQLTRHRLASFSVQSQRYCGCEPEDVIIPQSIRDKGFRGSMTMLLTRIAGTYEALIEEGVPEEDARFVLPQGVTTRLMMTANARELRHFFSLRCCNRAQWGNPSAGGRDAQTMPGGCAAALCGRGVRLHGGQALPGGVALLRQAARSGA